MNRIRWTEMVKRRPESTGGKQVTGRELTQFRPGQSGNPKGRPKGSRNKLTHGVSSTICARRGSAFGKPALMTAAWTHPVEFVRLVASLIPRESRGHRHRGSRGAHERMTNSRPYRPSRRRRRSYGGRRKTREDSFSRWAGLVRRRALRRIIVLLDVAASCLRSV